MMHAKTCGCPVGRDRTVETGVLAAGEAGLNVLQESAPWLEDQVRLFAADTDLASLGMAPVDRASKIFLGGLDEYGEAFENGELGKRCAEMTRPKWSLKLRGLETLILVGGLGGNTASGSLPVIAGEAKSQGIFTIAVVGMPFSFEGRERMDIAIDAVHKLETVCDRVIRVEGSAIEKSTDPHGSYDFFRLSDDELAEAVEALALSLADGNVALEAALREQSQLGKGAVSASVWGGMPTPARTAFFRLVSRLNLTSVPLERAQSVWLCVRAGEQVMKLSNEIEAMLLSVAPMASITCVPDPSGGDDEIQVTVFCMGVHAPEKKKKEAVFGGLHVAPVMAAGGSLMAVMNKDN